MPSFLQKRRRVKLLTTSPTGHACKISDQREGSLPYIWVRNSTQILAAQHGLRLAGQVNGFRGPIAGTTPA